MLWPSMRRTPSSSRSVDGCLRSTHAPHCHPVHIRLKKSLRWVNALLMRSAVDEVACHPDDAADCSDLIAHLDRHMISGFDTITIA